MGKLNLDEVLDMMESGAIVLFEYKLGGIVKEIRELQKQNEWRSMETAPKDGTHILIKEKEKENEAVIFKVAWLDVNEDNRLDENEYWAWCIPESWQDELGYYIITNPVGWLPLPKK